MFVEKQTYFVFLQVKELYIVAFLYLIFVSLKLSVLF